MHDNLIYGDLPFCTNIRIVPLCSLHWTVLCFQIDCSGIIFSLTCIINFLCLFCPWGGGGEYTNALKITLLKKIHFHPHSSYIACILNCKVSAYIFCLYCTTHSFHKVFHSDLLKSPMPIMSLKSVNTFKLSSNWVSQQHLVWLASPFFYIFCKDLFSKPPWTPHLLMSIPSSSSPLSRFSLFSFPEDLQMSACPRARCPTLFCMCNPIDC